MNKINYFFILLFVFVSNISFSQNIIFPSYEKYHEIDLKFDDLIGYGNYFATNLFYVKFKENEIAFKNDFSDKYFRIGGEVTKVTTTVFDDAFVVKLDIDKTFSDAGLIFPSNISKKAKSRLASLRKGDKISLIAKIGKDYSEMYAACYENSDGEIDIILGNSDDIPEKNKAEINTNDWLNDFLYSMTAHIKAKSGVNLRKSPFLQAEIVRILPFGTEIIILNKDGPKDTIDGITGNWYYVQVSGELLDKEIVGWCFSGYIE